MLSPVHIKPVLFKNLVKVVNQDCPGFNFSGKKCTSLSETKIKEGKFVGPDIKKLLKDPAFISSLNDMLILLRKVAVFRK